ncbi:MAG TPA: hypothetical protein VGU74_10590 [Gemmatimonadales bacterium]|nr:hypothetical protein [Gemmatimonadales bacterium]
MTRYFAFLLLLAGPVACTEVTSAPGDCPTFCPNGTIESKDTIFTDIIVRDSSYRGYIQGYQAEAMTAADIPGVIDSRAFFVTNKISTDTTSPLDSTTRVPYFADSVRLSLIMVRRDTLATNLRVKLYALPVTADSTSTFFSLQPYFAGPVVDSFSVGAILSQPAIHDTVGQRLYGDSVFWTDSAGHVITARDSGRTLNLIWHLDSLQAPLVAADSGRLAYGIRVAADSFATVAFSTLEAGGQPALIWYFHYTQPDTATSTPDTVVARVASRAAQFDSFVFDRAVQPLDSNLTVGGVPSARSLLRVDLPAYIRDSIDVVRATLILVPVAPVLGSPADSFELRALPVLADVGAKSPVTGVLTFKTIIHLNSADTVRMELTDLVRNWALDTTQTRSVMLGQVPEAASYPEIHFYSSRAPAFRPALHITYVKRYPFGTP